MKSKVLYLILLIFISCENKKESLLAEFPIQESVELKEKDFELDSLRNPYLMNCVNGKLVFANLYQDALLSIFNSTTGKHEKDLLKRGEAPNESLFITSVHGCDNDIAVLDTRKKQIAIFSNDTISNIVHLQGDTAIVQSVFNGISLSRDYFVATGIVNGNRLALFKGGKAITKFGQYPDSKGTDVEKAFAYQGHLAYNSNKKVLAVGSAHGESISFYRMEDSLHPSLIQEYTYSLPSYQDNSNDRSSGVIFLKDNITGFISLTSSADYCIGLYRGTPRDRFDFGGNLLLFFDWDGEPVKALRLDQAYEYVACDEKNSEVVLFGTDKDTGDYKISCLPVN